MMHVGLAMPQLRLTVGDDGGGVGRGDGGGGVGSGDGGGGVGCGDGGDEA